MEFKSRIFATSRGSTIDAIGEGRYLVCNPAYCFMVHGLRQAHEAVGALVAQCESQGISLKELTLDQLKAAHHDFGEDALQIDLNYSLSARNASGGTAPDTVASALTEAKKRLRQDRQAWTTLQK